MAVPKRKTSKSVKNKRRTHKKVMSINFSLCPNCGEPKMPHRVCLDCGMYRDKVIVKTE